MKRFLVAIRKRLPVGKKPIVAVSSEPKVAANEKSLAHLVSQGAASTYTIQTGDTFSVIATKLGTTVAVLVQANPGVNPSNLQIGQVILLQPSASMYTIVAGDTFSSIASKLGTSVIALEMANQGVDPNNLQIGVQISIPSGAGTAAPPAAQPQPPAPAPAPPVAGTYIILAGDTFSSIAAKLGTTVAALEAANPSLTPNNLQIGASIVVPSSSPSAPNPTPAPAPVPVLAQPGPSAPAPVVPTPGGTYVIQAGDTFFSIAAKLGTTVAALESANPALTPTNLQVGTSIVVPATQSAPSPPVPAPMPSPVVPAPPAPTPPTSGATYIIQAGDTLSLISSKFGVSLAALEAANPSINFGVLQIGQVINLPSGATSSSPPGPTPGAFVNYSGPASAYPDPSQWATYASLWQQNSALMSYNDSAPEIALIGSSILVVAAESGIDARVILCLIMQESGGNVRVGNTNNGVNNTGIMQAFDGVSFNPADPGGSILQMIRDGTEGTNNGPGLKQAYVQYGNYYDALRKYNSGSVDVNQLNNPLGATANYVVNIANRLMGHTWAGM